MPPTVDLAARGRNAATVHRNVVRRVGRVVDGASLGLRLAVVVGFLVVLGVIFGAIKGASSVEQVSVNGLVTGSYLAMGAVGLSFVYGILRLINFAHGDYLTFGAYSTLLLNVTAHVALIPSILFGVAMTSALSVALELGLWRPLRRRGAAGLQLILATIGLAFLLRYTIQFVAGPDLQQLRINDTTSVSLGGGVYVGRTILISTIVGYVVLMLSALTMRYTRLGKQMRALADSLDLAETTGLDTGRLIVITWAVGGALAGLAGTLYVLSTGAFDPQFGFTLLLPLFAAVLLGGAGSPYGAIAGGLIIGIAEEWSTLFVQPGWKVVVAFGVLIVTLLARPEGVFAPAGRV
jgi:branched-chain amino acid transport system permease protein